MASVPQKKRCGKCGVEKPLSEFHRRGNRWKSDCKYCRNEAKRKYVEENYRRVREGDAEYRYHNGVLLAERQKKWREANPERYSEIHARWKAANKAKVNAATHRRRCRLKGCAGSWTAAEWEALKAAQGHTCLCCGRKEPEIALTVDHVVPVSRGGDNTVANLQGLCKSCNSAKHTLDTDFR